MANYQKKKIQEAPDGNFGHYDEEVGGGASPHPKQPGTHGHGVNSDHRKENNDTMQPRTDDGKFTYKSVNGQSIDPKYGKSRGKTVNPLLTGGKNGVKIEDVEKDFASESGTYWNKYKDIWYTKGGEMVLQSGKKWQTRVAGKNIWDLAKERYDKVKGEFEGESSTFDETKKGRTGAEEKAAKQKAYLTGEEQSVLNQKTGGIKLKPGYTFTPKVQPTPTQASPTQPSPVVPPMGGGTQPTTGVGATASAGAPVPSAAPKSKYSDDDLEVAKEFFDANNIDYQGLSVEDMDKLIDKYFEEDTGETQTQPQAQAPVEENKTPEEDSEAVKKIKAMGFDGE